MGSAPNRLIPSPLDVDVEWSTTIATDPNWKIVYVPGDTDNEAEYLESKYQMAEI